MFVQLCLGPFMWKKMSALGHEFILLWNREATILLNLFHNTAHCLDVKEMQSERDTKKEFSLCFFLEAESTNLTPKSKMPAGSSSDEN